MVNTIYYLIGHASFQRCTAFLSSRQVIRKTSNIRNLYSSTAQKFNKIKASMYKVAYEYTVSEIVQA